MDELRTGIAGLLRRYDVFSDEYYLRSYRGCIPAGMEPLQHFLHTGLELGLKPNATFDPLVYRLLHPDVGSADVLKHYLEHHAGTGATFDIRKALGLVEKTPTFLPVKAFDIDLEASMQESLAKADTFAEPRELEFTAAGRPYRLIVPRPETLLDRLDQDRPFAIARISHGDWDDLYVFRRYSGRVARAAGSIGSLELSDHQIDRLTARLLDLFYPEEGVFEENFLVEMIADLETHPVHPDFLFSVGFKGYPTADDQPFFRTFDLKPVDLARLRIFSEYFDSAEPLYDANLFKRWAVAGVLARLPELARQRPVILMGASRLASLGKRWRLPWLLHIAMPPARAVTQRYGLLDEARAKIAEANDIAGRHNTKRPLFLLQGSSFAYWMMKRLFPDHRDVFYLDLGLALHIWFYDREDMPVMPERRLYGRTIVKNCGLEDYYRNLGMLLTPEMADTGT